MNRSTPDGSRTGWSRFQIHSGASWTACDSSPPSVETISIAGQEMTNGRLGPRTAEVASPKSLLREDGRISGVSTSFPTWRADSAFIQTGDIGRFRPRLLTGRSKTLFAQNMNPYRRHGRDSFFKYTTASTGLIILRNLTLRWSNPEFFNDPYDVPKEILEGVVDEDVHQAFYSRLQQLAINPTLPSEVHLSPLTKGLLQIFKLANEATKQAIVADLERAKNERATTSENLEEIRRKWRDLHGKQRMLCLTERWESASMWNHYADSHTGVVIEFACRDDLDSVLLLAEPMNYSDEPISVGTPEGFAESLLFDIPHSIKRMMDEYRFTKTKDWEYEREWRVGSFARDGQHGAHSDYGFNPQEVKGVILGAKISAENRAAMLDAVRRNCPHATVWQASVAGGRWLQRQQID
jgi:hypothetical protein